jgi:benzoate/toluate 1,2-dioxygenase beta subunit
LTQLRSASTAIGSRWAIQAKQVNLLECDQCIRNPSIIL